MAQTREALLDNFDEDVHARLKVHRKQAFSSLSDRERWLLALTQHELQNDATFDPKKPRFFYTGSESRQGNYNLDWKLAEKHGDTFFRADHPLAVKLLKRAKGRELGIAEVTFDYAAHGSKIAALETFRGSSGWLELSKLTVQSFESEEFLVFAAATDDNTRLDSDLCYKLLNLPSRITSQSHPTPSGPILDQARTDETSRCVKQVDDRNGLFFDEEVAKLERWSDDLKLGLEREIKDLDQQIKEIRRESQTATALTEKLAAQKRLKAAESERNKKRRELYDAQDAIDKQRDALIAKIEGQLRMSECIEPLFVFRWSLT
jgi:adenine-specific DNA-methyltransferase